MSNAPPAGSARLSIRTPVMDELGLEVPLFAFSKAPAVVAAVSRAGGMGVLGAVAYTVDQLRDALDWIDEHVDGKPYGVDVVIPAKYEAGSAGHHAPLDLAQLEAMISPRHRAFIDELLALHQVPPLPPGGASA
jgi:NAD(P)H-dependent flavin oxidoreductase YrpB (nitropropane dioxygenase family)